MAKTYLIKKTQKIPVGLNAAWNFFSKPDNLKKIIPKNIKFIPLAINSSPIYPGQIIEYKVMTSVGVPLRWLTKIIEVEEKKYFVDEQLSGPFKEWRHQHFFIEIPGGVLMTDIIQYKCRLGKIGPVTNAIFLRRRVNQIFDYRAKQLVKLFGEYAEPQNWNSTINDITDEEINQASA